MAGRIRCPWTIQEQVDVYQNMKRRMFWSKLFLFLLTAIIIAPVIVFKLDWIIVQLK